MFPPELATALTSIIQGLIVLFVSADILVVYLWRLRRKLPQAAAASTGRHAHERRERRWRDVAAAG